MIIQQLIVVGYFLCDRSKSGSGGADGGGTAATGVSARSPEPLQCVIAQSRQRAHKRTHVATTGRVHTLRQTHSV